MALSEVCAIVGEPLADPISLATALTTGAAVEKGGGSEFVPASIEVDVGNPEDDLELAEPRATLPPGGGSPDSSIKLLVHVCPSPENLVELRPKVVVLCFTPLVHATLDAIIDVWVPAVCQMSPRPVLCAVGTRVDALGNRKVLNRMKAAGTAAVPVREILELISRIGKVCCYTEVSASTYANMKLFERAIARAAITRADLRPTPEIAERMRQRCITSLRESASTWLAKRNTAGKLFYFNRATKLSQWERPLDFDGEEIEMTIEEQREIDEKKQQQEEKKRQEDLAREKMREEDRETRDYEMRLLELEFKQNKLKAGIVQLQTYMANLSEQGKQNEEEKRQLVSLKETVRTEEKALLSDNVMSDLQLEKEIQKAKERQFEYETLVGLKEEQDYDLQVAENVIQNRSLATNLRELLQQQLQIQHNAAAAHSQFAVCAKQQDDLSKMIAYHVSRLSEIARQKRERLEEVKQLEGKHQKLLSEIHSERERLIAATGFHCTAETERQAKVKNLMDLCNELDVRIAALQEAQAKVFVSSSGKRQSFVGSQKVPSVVEGVKQEVERLQAERRQLVDNLASLAAANAMMEVSCEKQRIIMDHAVGEITFVYDKLEGVLSETLRLRRGNKVKFFEGKGYSPMTRYELQQSTEAMAVEEKRQAKVRKRFGGDAIPDDSEQRIGASEVQILKTKVELLEGQGNAYCAALTASAQRLRNLKYEHNMDAKRFGDILNQIVELLQRVQELPLSAAQISSPHGYSLGDTSGLSQLSEVRPDAAPQISPLERLMRIAGPALCSAPEAMKRLSNRFAAEVVRRHELMTDRSREMTQAPSAILGGATPSRTAASAIEVARAATSATRRGPSHSMLLPAEVEKAQEKATRLRAEYNRLLDGEKERMGISDVNVGERDTYISRKTRVAVSSRAKRPAGKAGQRPHSSSLFQHVSHGPL